jgi:tetratricopeptide (TPR) repeat protein
MPAATLTVLEPRNRAQDQQSPPGRFATASLLVVLTLAMAAGLFAVTMAIWVPEVKAAFDPRKSIAETLSATIAWGGVDAAVKQYHDLKAASPVIYNFDEDELNSLGYRLIRRKKLAEAIRIFQLNIAAAYPNSSNAYDSLAEGYMDAGDKAQAIAYYQKAIELDPKNGNSISMLRKLTAP